MPDSRQLTAGGRQDDPDGPIDLAQVTITISVLASYTTQESALANRYANGLWLAASRVQTRRRSAPVRATEERLVELSVRPYIWGAMAFGTTCGWNPPCVFRY